MAPLADPYDLRIMIGGHRLYIETRLMYDDLADP